MARTPKDWNLQLVRSREARALLPTHPGSPHVAWGNIRVAHLDTGYTEHPAFGDWTAGTQWLQPAEGLNRREPGTAPRDSLTYEGNPGHGTRTCSVLCGDAVPVPGTPLPTGELGVAPRLPVVPCRIVNSVVLTPEYNREAVAAGIRHAITRRCQVVSMSLGIPFMPFFATGGMGHAVDEAYEAGLILVAAGGQVVDSVCYPAKYSRTIGVGGVTPARRIWFRYRVGGEMIDVWAPAADVQRADPLATEGAVAVRPVEGADPGMSGLSSESSSGGYGSGAGTSYATVHVAAAAAMWLVARGAEIAAGYPQPWQRIEAFRLLLQATAIPLVGPQLENGTGILNIEALLRAPLPAAGSLRKAPEDKHKVN
jgi:subtilisin family serine protease